MLAIAGTAALAILALFLFAEFVNAVGAFGYPSSPIQNTITVQGTGKATTTPDVASVSFTVMENASSVSAAQSAATDKANAAIAAMKAAGIADADIQTENYSVSPQYAPSVCAAGVYCPPSNKISGYQVSESVDLKIRDTSTVGDILQKLGDLGVQNVSGPNFGQEDDSATQDSARAAAIKDAQEKAATLAAQLGVHLGKVVSFSENSGGYPMPVMYASAGSAAKDAAIPNLPVGTSESSVTVSITYAIR
jgi:uncharacterized protein YggE